MALSPTLLLLPLLLQEYLSSGQQGLDDLLVALGVTPQQHKDQGQGTAAEAALHHGPGGPRAGGWVGVGGWVGAASDWVGEGAWSSKQRPAKQV